MMHAAETKPEGHFQPSQTRDEAAPPISKDSSGSGGDRQILALPERLRKRWADSVWLPVVTRGAAVALAMGALAAVGAYRTTTAPGVPLTTERPTTSVAGVWVAPDLAPSPHRESSHAQVAPGPSSATPPPAITSAKAHSVEQSEQPPGNTKADQVDVGVTPDGKVILNRATAAELTRLPRVGPKRASAIVALRERLGRFRKPTDLLRVKGIGVKTLRKMLPHLVVDPPKQEP